MTASAAEARSKGGFRFCLNTSTIQGQKLTLEEEVDIAAKAGYHAIEPWINEIERHVESGKSLSDLRKRIHDHGMTVEDGIGFAEWIVDDDARRAKGLETAKRDMDLLAQLGCPHIAAPAAGARTPSVRPEVPLQPLYTIAHARCAPGLISDGARR